MYAQGIKSVVRCYYRMHAIFVAQIGGVLELERHDAAIVER